MSAGTFKIFKIAKKYIGNGTITLGSGVFKMALCRTSASAAVAALTISTWASISGTEISAKGGYVAGGRNVVPATGDWVTGASAGQYKFTMSTVGILFTASTATLHNIKYCIVRNSTGAGAGKLVMCCTLSTAAFSIVSPNILTIQANASGFFTLT